MQAQVSATATARSRIGGATKGRVGSVTTQRGGRWPPRRPWVVLDPDSTVPTKRPWLWGDRRHRTV